MTDPYLIAHKVHGEPAFDIATRIKCAVCHDANSCGDYEGPACHECDTLGYWWIIPTSGHRAYPYWNHPVQAILDRAEYGERWGEPLPLMPPSLPDHYAHKAAPSIDLAAALGFTKPKPSQPAKPFPRRI